MKDRVTEGSIYHTEKEDLPTGNSGERAAVSPSLQSAWDVRRKAALHLQGTLKISAGAATENRNNFQPEQGQRVVSAQLRSRTINNLESTVGVCVCA